MSTAMPAACGTGWPVTDGCAFAGAERDMAAAIVAAPNTNAFTLPPNERLPEHGGRARRWEDVLVVKTSVAAQLPRLRVTRFAVRRPSEAPSRRTIPRACAAPRPREARASARIRATRREQVRGGAIAPRLSHSRLGPWL